MTGFKNNNSFSNSQIGDESKAISLLKNGNINDAEIIFRNLISKGIANYKTFFNLSLICSHKSRNDEAIDLLKQAIEINPEYPEAFFSMANLLKVKGDLDSAISFYKKAIDLRSNYLDAHINLGNAYFRKSKFTSAINSYENALKIDSSSADIFINISSAYIRISSFNEAEKYLLLAKKCNPSIPTIYSKLGDIYYKLKKYNDAEIFYKKALNLNPSIVYIYSNLGNIYRALSRFDESINCFKKAISLKYDFVEAHSNLAITYQETGQIDLSKKCIYEALRLTPNSADLYNNLGSIFQQEGQINLAKDFFRKAISINPSHPDARFNLGLIQLSLSNFEDGFSNYEYRFSRDDAIKPLLTPNVPMWNGDILPNGEKLLIVAEQGLGDTLHFMRYIPFLVENGINVSFCAQAKLHELIKSSNIHPSPICSDDAKNFSKGKWIPLLSIPRLIGVNPSNSRLHSPYISVKNEVGLLSKWKNKFLSENKLVIGINWQGNPDAEKRNLKGRSFSLDLFSRFFPKHNFKLVALQKGYGLEQLDKCSFRHRFVSCQEEINVTWDFLNTAAIVANCHLIITSDTHIAHLAGGMGKPTFLLLHTPPDWRWGIKGSSSFWYPSIKLFRQKERYNWADVFDRVSEQILK